MNYELAKKLKDAGFPQEGDSLYYYDNDENENIWEGDELKDTDIYEPTLEELIEACGDDFHAMVRMKKGWRVNPIGYKDTWIEWKEYACDGDTPEEAVAELWLALNKKQ